MLHHRDAEVLFPHRVTQTLGTLRGPQWQQLVAGVSQRPERDLDVLAFSLLMIRLGGCLACTPDNYRALRGCTFCARQTVLRFKGTDDDLLALWAIARADILAWQQTGFAPVTG